MTQAHTPGPWALKHITYLGQHIIAKNGDVIAHMNASKGEFKGNANLMVASPELLASLQEILHRAESEAETLSELGRNDELTAEEAKIAWEEIARACAAIAKAIGAAE